MQFWVRADPSFPHIGVNGTGGDTFTCEGVKL
jgi:hypothetical protein